MTAPLQSYTEPLDTRYDSSASSILGHDHWRVLTPFKYYIGEKYSNAWVTIPAGYLTDGASVPRMFWNMIPPWGKYGQAAVVHDYLCEYLSITVDGLPSIITRAECDEILYEAMKVLLVDPLVAGSIYYSVCLYRTLWHVDKPSNTPLKRQLEAEWAAKQTVGVTTT